MMQPILRVIDVETSGLDPAAGAALLEVGIVTRDVPAGTGVPRYYPTGWFVEHDGPIPPEAKAVHHITESHVSLAGGAKTRAIHSTLLRQFDNEAAVWAAHNADFDRRFLPELQRPFVCTYRCALHLWPEAPGHSVQVLRYWLGGEPAPEDLDGRAPHRALYDCFCTMQILERMLVTHTVDELLALTAEPVLLYRVRFGKHKGALWSQLPQDYLRWVLRDGGFDADVVHTARYYLGLL
jgi:exodeoxyribonuclease X